MRKFYLTNANGKKLDLNGEAFFYNPAGLGFSYNSEYRRAENQFIEIQSIIDQKRPSGTIMFRDYDHYTEFVKFCQHKPLILEYVPSRETYRLACKISSLDKTEIGEGGVLNCEIEFEGIGQWYQYIYLETDPNAKGKTYDYKYPFKYTSASANTVKFDAESSLTSPVTLTFIGEVVNPSWSHYINGELVAEGKVNATIEEGHRLVVSSAMPMKIVETDSSSNEVRDLYGASDFSTERFLNIGLGTNVITCRSESTKTYAIVEGFEYFESV